MISLLLTLIFSFLISTLRAADEACATNIRQEGREEGSAGFAPQLESTILQNNAGEERDLFYAWPTDKEIPLINALFPDTKRLQSAWEVHPLLSRVSFLDEKQRRRPTIFHDRTSLSQLNKDLDLNHYRSDHRSISWDDPLLSLFALDDVPLVLSQEMRHGSDYKLVKKVVLPSTHPDSPGEEYNGMLPEPHYNFQEVLRHFHHGAFSLVINKMQHRWGAVARMARVIEEGLGVLQVGANLYLTPEVMDMGSHVQNGDVRQGFEAHWDWMDVIVIQLSGRKRWSVAREPSIYLSNNDQKRKPTKVELEDLRRYSDITLCPGDVLYIPRGHIHNASTVAFNKLSESGLDLDNCPSYPKEIPLAMLANRLDGPSLHLTFGLLQSSGGTIESLLHHALDAYFASPVSNTHERVAIPARSCPRSSSGQVTMDYDVEWKTIFHHSLAEVARREHACDILLSNNSATQESRRCAGSVILRKSVPLLLLIINGNNLNEANVDDQQLSNLKRTYFLALDAFRSYDSMPKTMDFMHHLLKSPSEEDLRFSYPGFGQKDVILCPEALSMLSEDMHLHRLKSFDQFARDNFVEALKGMNLWGKKRRDENRQQQELDLEAVGQGGGTHILIKQYI